jgi:hypothetical protein
MNEKDRRNGHSVRRIDLDDSSPTNRENYHPLLEQTRTHNESHAFSLPTNRHSNPAQPPDRSGSPRPKESQR